MADAAADKRRRSVAAERNREPILEQLRRWLPPSGTMLEIAAGTGEHALHFAAALPGWQWQPTDPHPNGAGLDRGLARAAALLNLLPPLALDVPRRSGR